MMLLNRDEEYTVAVAIELAMSTHPNLTDGTKERFVALHRRIGSRHATRAALNKLAADSSPPPQSA
jgi:hypothetical protein